MYESLWPAMNERMRRCWAAGEAQSLCRGGVTAVAALLKEAGHSLQSNRKTREALTHPDRDAQFEHINIRKRRSC
jgi:hypothetical protein